MASPDVEFKCFVGGFEDETDEKDLESAFSKFGDVIETKIICDRVTGKSRNFGFITFKDEKPMRDAIKEMNGRKLDGSKVDPKDAKFECFVGDLAECTTEKDLERGFSLLSVPSYAERIFIAYDTETQNSRRFGYVTFKDKESMSNAIEDLYGLDLLDHRIFDDRSLEATRIINGDENKSLYLSVRKSKRSYHVITVKEAWPRKPSAAERARSLRDLLRRLARKN